MTELERKTLQDYKSAYGLADGNSINQRIRSGQEFQEIGMLDNLMQEGETPSTLYRVLENGLVCIKGGIIQDSAFLSTSSDAEYAMSSYMSTNTALLVIRNSDQLPSIDIVKYLGKTNYESEYVLQRNIQFEVLRMVKYTSNNWMRLKEDFSLHNLNEREWFGVNSITVYELSPKFT